MMFTLLSLILVTAFGQDEWCESGLLNVESTVCCHPECGQSGLEGCAKADVRGGQCDGMSSEERSKCCPAAILDSGVPCSESNAPCVYSPDPNPDPECEWGPSNARGDICCHWKCGQCGGPGCGGPNDGLRDVWLQKNCCAGFIAASGKHCSDNAAPCILSN